MTRLSAIVVKSRSKCPGFNVKAALLKYRENKKKGRKERKHYAVMRTFFGQKSALKLFGSRDKMR